MLCCFLTTFCHLYNIVSRAESCKRRCKRYLHYADVCSFHHYPAWYPTSAPGNMEEVKQIPLIWEAPNWGSAKFEVQIDRDHITVLSASCWPGMGVRSPTLGRPMADMWKKLFQRSPCSSPRPENRTRIHMERPSNNHILKNRTEKMEDPSCCINKNRKNHIIALLYPVVSLCHFLILSKGRRRGLIRAPWAQRRKMDRGIPKLGAPEKAKVVGNLYTNMLFLFVPWNIRWNCPCIQRSKSLTLRHIEVLKPRVGPTALEEIIYMQD